MSLADNYLIDGTNGRDFRRCAGEEDFVGDVQHVAGNDLLADFVAQVFGNRHGGVAGDAGQDRRPNRRGVDDAIEHQEDILAGAFADVASNVQHNRFAIAVFERFHLGKLAVDVLTANLRQRGRLVGGHAPPRTHAHIHAALDGFGAEVRAPEPAHDDQRRGTFTPIHAQDFGAAKYQRANVTRWLTVAADGFLNGIGNFLMRPG